MPGLRRFWASQAGIGLIETTIAMVLALIMFTVVGTTLGVAMTQTKESRVQQQATATAAAAVEEMRGLGWDELAMSATTPDDPRIVTGPALAASALGLAQPEPLVIDGVSGLIPPSAVETVSGIDYTLHKYVTAPSSGLRRGVVVVTWQDGDDGATRTAVMSALISEILQPAVTTTTGG